MAATMRQICTRMGIPGKLFNMQLATWSDKVVVANALMEHLERGSGVPIKLRSQFASGPGANEIAGELWLVPDISARELCA